MAEIKLKKICKNFEGKEVIKDMDLLVHKGELLALLGQSGCGKTTTLRMISGLLVPDSGEIYFDGEMVTKLDKRSRGAVMVFQDHRLFPHMTVFENIAFGLRVRKTARKLVQEKVKWAMEMVKLSGFEDRFPVELSGGQSQRVALARALVLQPKVLLLDEPLSNLDAVLRDEMRSLIQSLHHSLNLTIIFVTHDQKEAMVLADRVAVMNQGIIEQLDTPTMIYYRPTNPWVASFVGLANLLVATVNEGRINSVLGQWDGANFLPEQWPEGQIDHGQVTIFVRPEEIQLRKADVSLTGEVSGEVIKYSFTGEMWHYHVNVQGTTILVACSGQQRSYPGDKVQLRILDKSLCIYPDKVRSD